MQSKLIKYSLDRERTSSVVLLIIQGVKAYSHFFGARESTKPLEENPHYYSPPPFDSVPEKPDTI
uniref:Uncharacterized protein n=1 Tax=Timema douglasi TaxID=61478 RepID=A0A7R8VAI9_TIMDO|nr:unnamed protein product [Timema douglasi]